MQNINEIEELVKLISKLPGLGPKSAKRIVLKLINNRDELVKPLAKSLADVYKNIVRCKICGTLKSNSIECNFDNCKIVEKKYNKILLIISFLIGILGLVIIMRLVEVSFPNKKVSIVDKNAINKIDNKNHRKFFSSMLNYLKCSYNSSMIFIIYFLVIFNIFFF